VDLIPVRLPAAAKWDLREGFFSFPIDFYHALPAMSKSSWGSFAVNGDNFLFERSTVGKATSWYTLGSAAHCALLEPYLFADNYVVAPPEVLAADGSRRGKKYTAWQAQQADRTILAQDQMDHIRGMVQSVMTDPRRELPRQLLTGGVAELSGVYRDPDFPEIWQKIRPDYLPGRCLAVDLKTGKKGTAAPDRFARDCVNYGYHHSAWLILRGLTQLTGKQHTRYIFVVVETEPPYLCATYEMSWDKNPKWLIRAEQDLKPLFAQFNECLQVGKFWGYPDDLVALEPPRWL